MYIILYHSNDPNGLINPCGFLLQFGWANQVPVVPGPKYLGFSFGTRYWKIIDNHPKVPRTLFIIFQYVNFMNISLRTRRSEISWIFHHFPSFNVAFLPGVVA